MAPRTEKVAESIARQILQDVRQQNLQPGSMLPSEAHMLERFRVGRGSLREALRILEVNGLLTLKPGPKGGPIVRAQDSVALGQVLTLHLQSIGATYRQLLQARVEYEVVLARLAAERPTEDGGTITLLLAPDDDVTDDQRYGNAAAQFHRAIAAASGNPVLAMVSDAIYSIWTVRVTRVLYPVAERASVLRRHVAIARAIDRHDARRAERLMREHMTAYMAHCEVRYPGRMDEFVDWD